MEMKYIIFEDDGLEFPVIFPAVAQHNSIIAHSKWGGKLTPVSAGFVALDFNAKDIFAYGDSFSLKLKSRPVDSAIITNFIKQAGGW